VRRALAELAPGDIELVSLRPTRLADVWADVRRVGRALGRSERGEALAAELERRTNVLAQRATRSAGRPSVLTLEWLDPVMIGGLWMPELVTLAGGTPLVTAPGQHAPTLTRAELAELDPDVVLIKPCGFALERSADELALLARNLPWERWRAVRAGRVFVADGNAYFNRSGPRLVESLEILAACVHPESCGELLGEHRDAVRRVTPNLELEPIRDAGH
jgi:iron complex transport system substrate-binding protein